MRRHVKTLTVEEIRDEAFMKGLDDGQHGRAFDPYWKYGPDDRERYRAGFTRAREEPRC